MHFITFYNSHFVLNCPQRYTFITKMYLGIVVKLLKTVHDN